MDERDTFADTSAVLLVVEFTEVTVVVIPSLSGLEDQFRLKRVYRLTKKAPLGGGAGGNK